MKTTLVQHVTQGRESDKGKEGMSAMNDG